MGVLTPNQQQLLNKVRTESAERVKQALIKASLGKKKLQQLKKAKQALERTSLVLNHDLRKGYRRGDVLDSLLDIRRLMTFLETGDFPGGIYNQKFRDRLLNEFKIYGASRDIQTIFSHTLDSERPIYGALDYLDRPNSFAPLIRFGHYRFVLRPELKTRSTFTPADSFMVERDEVYDWENIDGVLAARLDGRFWFEYVLAKTEPYSLFEGIYYIEAQILGGVALSDITRLYYPAGDRLDPVFWAKLERLNAEYGIDLVHY